MYKSLYRNNHSQNHRPHGTLRLDQVIVVEKMCTERHYLHTYKNSYCNTDKHHSTFLKAVKFFSKSMERFLNTADLSSLDIDELMTMLNDYVAIANNSSYLEYNKSYISDNIIFVCELINTKIEDYLRKLDNTYGSKYCPSGYKRAQRAMAI